MLEFWRGWLATPFTTPTKQGAQFEADDFCFPQQRGSLAAVETGGIPLATRRLFGLAVDCLSLQKIVVGSNPTRRTCGKVVLFSMVYHARLEERSKNSPLDFTGGVENSP